MKLDFSSVGGRGRAPLVKSRLAFFSREWMCRPDALEVDICSERRLGESGVGSLDGELDSRPDLSQTNSKGFPNGSIGFDVNIVHHLPQALCIILSTLIMYHAIPCI